MFSLLCLKSHHTLRPTPSKVHSGQPEWVAVNCDWLWWAVLINMRAVLNFHHRMSTEMEIGEQDMGGLPNLENEQQEVPNTFIKQSMSSICWLTGGCWVSLHSFGSGNPNLTSVDGEGDAPDEWPGKRGIGCGHSQQSSQVTSDSIWLLCGLSSKGRD